MDHHGIENQMTCCLIQECWFGCMLWAVTQSIAALWWNSIRTTETITAMLDFVYAGKSYDKSIITNIQVFLGPRPLLYRFESHEAGPM